MLDFANDKGQDCLSPLECPHDVNWATPWPLSDRAGEVGELHVRGPNVMLGYYRAPDLTAAAIDSDGWFKTGDLARLDNDCLYIVGRAKEMIIRSGFNVYPAEVEAVINSHPAVTQSAVVGKPVAGNEEVIAFVQLQANSEISVEDLVSHINPLLTPYKRPSQIIRLENLPATSTGKILKSKLAASLQEPRKKSKPLHLRVDPAELRRKNFITQFPYQTRR